MSVKSNIAAQTDSFVQQWNQRTAAYPVLSLDYSWPSVGTVGLLSTILIGKPNFTNEELEFVNVLSWYMGSIISSTWTEAGIVSELTLDDDGVKISGKLLEASEVPFSSNLSLVTRALLQQLLFPIPVLTSYQRELPISADLFSPTMLGIALCQSSLLDGIEPNDNQAPFVELSNKIVKSLSTSTAQYYERCFPEEPLGQMAEIYLGGQIYPPLGMNETWPCINSATELSKSVKELGASNRAILKLAENLLTFPCEHLSNTGLVVFAALSSQPIAPKTVAHFKIKGDFLGFLRPAVTQVREVLKVNTDWMKSEIPTKEDFATFEIERKLGLLPWIAMNISILSQRQKEAKIVKLFKSLVGFDLSGAVGVADSIIEKNPENLEVRFQRVNLHLLAGEIQQAEFAIRLLASEPEAESDPRLYLYWTKIDLLIENPEEAVRHIELALSYWSQEHSEYSNLLHQVLSGIIYSGQATAALMVLEKIPREIQAEYPYLVNKYRALTLLESNHEASLLLQKIAALCPINPEIFYNFFLK